MFTVFWGIKMNKLIFFEKKNDMIFHECVKNYDFFNKKSKQKS